MGGKRGFLLHLPNILTAVRILLAPVLFLVVVGRSPIHATMGVLVLAAVTDLLDGSLARRLGVCSAAGGYADAAADLLVALAAFAAFAALGVYPYWSLGLVVAAFAAFVLTSGRAGPVRDPVGRHYGTFLYVAAGTTLALPDLAVAGAVLAALMCITAATVGCRAALLLHGTPG